MKARSNATGDASPAPERGFVSSTPGETWEEGLLCGNGMIGANALGRPLHETVIFTRERMYLPENGTANVHLTHPAL